MLIIAQAVVVRQDTVKDMRTSVRTNVVVLVPATCSVANRLIHFRTLASAAHVANLLFDGLAQDPGPVLEMELPAWLLLRRRQLAPVFAHDRREVWDDLSFYARRRCTLPGRFISAEKKALEPCVCPTCLPEATQRAHGRASSQLKCAFLQF